MATRVGTKTMNGRRMACTSSSGGKHGKKLDRMYPECRSKSAFLLVLRSELALPESASLKDIAHVLENKTWDGQHWLNDSAS